MAKKATLTSGHLFSEFSELCTGFYVTTLNKENFLVTVSGRLFASGFLMRS